MNNEQTSYFKRGLVLLMAVIMVFTYMPGGTWGADTAWAGEVTLKGSGTEVDPYLIESANDFAAMSSSGYSKLTKDITVETPYADEFTGTFDGDGHTVTLDITSNSSDGIGFFSTIGSGAVIKNLRIEGNITYEGETENKNGTGSIAGKCAGTISNCENYANVSGYSYIGGIVGILEKSGKVIGCANKGNVSGKNGSSRYIGGVTGNTKGDVSNCYNQGTITSNRADRVYLGGISGSLESGSTAENCYSTSDIEKKSNSAGIIGWSSSATVSNCYFLEKDALSGVNESGSTVTQVGSKTSNEMKTENFVMLLNNGNNETGAFKVKAGDYPALKWETPTASVNFTISPANATLTITSTEDSSVAYTGKGGTVALPAGEYSYTVSCEGYTEQSGTVTVSPEQANTGATLDAIDVTLQEDSNQWTTVAFTLEPNTATFELKNGDSVLTTQSGTTYKVLKNKIYTYTATADGYEDEDGSYCYDTNGGSRSISLKKVTGITLGGTYKKEYVQGDSLDTSGLVVTATLSDGANATTKEVSIEDCTVTGFDSTAVTESQTITVSYKCKTATYTVEIKEKLFPSRVFNALKGKATVEYSHNSSFKGKDGEEFIDDSTESALKSNSAGMNSSQVTVTIKFNENLKTSKLKFQYKVSSEENYDYLKINNETSKSLSGTIGWTEKELTVKGGDTVTIAYVKDSYGESGSDCVWLKTFQIEELRSISISPKEGGVDITGAAMTLKDSEGKAVSAGSDGKYYVVDGEYTYTVSKFGYADATGEITVSGSDVKQNVAMTKLDAHKATFHITLPEGLESGATSIVLKSGEEAMTANTDGSYSLPVGEYSYTVTHPYCDTVTGKITITDSDVNKAITLERKLVFGDFFDKLDGITAENDSTYPYEAVKDESGNYLRSSETIKNYDTASVTLTATKNVNVSFDYLGSNYGYSYYPFAVKKGSKTLLTSYDKTVWETFSTDLKNGESLTLMFSEPYSWGSNDYYVKLKNFATTPIYSAEITAVTEDAAIEVTDAEENVIEAISGTTYLLTDGEYSYKVSKYGYGTENGNFEISGKDMNINVPALTKLAEKTVRFSVNPSNAAVTVTHEKQGTIEPAEDGSYSLPVGESYRYTIAKTDYITVSGTLTVKSDQTVTENLTYAGEGWDGQTKTEPGKVGDVYQIGTAAELAWFANEANTTPAISGRLTANINLNEKTWGAFCEYVYNDDSSGFAGMLDGGGYIISGLAGKSGLIDCIAPKGIVKNLKLVGTIENTGSYSDPQNLGGIANTSKGTVENCMFSGKITNKYSGGSTAGIVGRAMTGNIIRNCVSDAEIANKATGYNQTLNLGGIAGYTYGTVENCYFTGSIYADPTKTGNKSIGGIVGTLNGGAELKNAYTVGSVVGPENGIGAVIGILGEASSYSDTPAGAVSNVHYLKGICEKAISTDGGTGTAGTAAHTVADMKTAIFAYGLGAAFNQDTTNINGGYPVLTWQGGATPVVPEFEQNALADMNAIVIKDKTRADALEAEKNEYFLYRDEEITTEDAAFELWKGFVKEETDPEYEELTWDDIYAYFGIDLTNDGTLSMDGSGIYSIPETCREIILPTVGENGSTIGWTSSDSAIVNIKEGTAEGAANTSTIASVTRPEGGNKTVTLTASVKNQNVTKTKEFTLLIKSAGGAAETKLDAIAARIEASRTYIQPMQMYDHTNIIEAMEQYLAREGYEVKNLDGEGIEVSLLSVGSKALPSDGVDYISSNGDITSYYKGTAGLSTTAAIYNDVHFRLALDGKEKEITMRVHIGWDVFYVEQMLERVLSEVTWDTIKGDNKNTSEDKNVSGVENDWTHTVVSGSIDQNLTLPQKLSKYSFAEISWSTLDDEDSQYIYAEENSDGTLTGILQRPPKADEGEESNDKEITLTATAKFTFWDDYTVSEMTSQGTATEPAIAQKFFDVTIAEGTEEEKADMKAALVEKYEDLITDFVNKTQSVDLANVTADLQLPRPAVLEDNGIMSDSYNQKVTMVSGNTDVLEFTGYHAVIYRPLPGSDPATVEYTVTITDRRTKNVLAQNTFAMTVQPLTQEEIDAAAAWMKEVTTEEVYWNGIKGENTDKNNVTSNLKAFEEILRGEDGSAEYVRGTVNITFSGIDVDDLPGYDSMNSQPWREFRSDYNSVIECETLFVTTPEYDTEVTIDSVFTDNIYGKYWEKFKSDDEYAQFAQFFKQPVSVTVTVKGEKGADPNPDSRPTTLSATVSVDGKNVNGFKSTSAISVSGLGRNATAWDAVTTALTKSGYKYDSFGDYISGVTDAGGVTLTDTDTKNSGWLYTVNGKLPDVYMGAYYLKDGDTIVLYYTSDYTKDEHAGGWSGKTEESKVVTNDDKTASTTTTTAPTETKVTEKINADGTKEKTVAVTVSADNQTEIIKQAADKKSTEIVLEVASTATSGAQNVQLQLNVSFVKNVSEKTDAALTVNTENGTVSLDQDTIKTVLSEAKGATITLDVNKVTSPTEVQKKAAGESGQILSLTVKSGDKTISDFKTGKVTVTVAIEAALQNKRVAAIHIAEDGKIEQMPGKSREVNGKKCYEFTTSHFSDFALVDADELGLETEDEIDPAALVAKLTPVARSAKTAKGYIKVTTSLDKSDKPIISDLKDAGYTVKYRFFRSTKKSANYKSALTKQATTYTNTTGKKGTKYFYKVQVRVYDASGKLAAKTALKQCKYACRTK